MSAEPVGEVRVGAHLLAEIDKRGWTQVEFAEIIGRPTQVVSEIIGGRKEITRSSATQIAAALGQTPEFWLGLQDRYHLSRQARDEDVRRQLQEVRLRARLHRLAPLAVLRKRGVITAATLKEEAEELRVLLGLDDLEGRPPLAALARRISPDERTARIHLAWLACVRQRAASLPAAPYDADGLAEIAPGLSREVRRPSAFAALPARLAQVGVRLVHVEALPSGQLDGASFDLHGSPVIGLSGLPARLDRVLFALLREAAHLVLDYPQGFEFPNPVGPGHERQKKDAESLAATWALPGPLPTVPDRPNRSWLDTTAESIGVHPAVIVGRLQDDGVLNDRSTLADHAPTVTEYLRAW